jgi:predicted nucleotidyltransferase
VLCSKGETGLERDGITDLVARIQAFLDRQQGYVVAYLFGSTAGGTAHHLSDIDVALLLPRDTDRETAMEMRLRVAAGLEVLSGRSVDVIVLNQAPPLLRFQVIQQGQVLVDRDPEIRYLFQARTMSEYYDARRYLDFHFGHLVRRIREEGLGAGVQGDRDAL